MGVAMPVTARLSKSFYDRFGDDVANELVEWFNAVDLTYRTDLRELNELNFARFDASMDARFAQADAKIERRFAEQDRKIDQRFAEYDAKWEQRFSQVDIRFAQIDRRFDALAAMLQLHIATFDTRMAQFEARMMRWMLTFWVGTLGGLAALLWALMQAR
jgi:hypothetical protein